MEMPSDIEQVQDMIDNGQAWQLEGAVGRYAMGYIDAGLCMLSEVGHTDYWGNYVPARTEVEPGNKGSAEYCTRMQQEA